MVDDADYEWLSQWKWHALKGRNTDYAYRGRLVSDTVAGKGGISMHRVLLDAPPGMAVDHRDGDGLNNVRSNIRLVTNAQNTWNSSSRGGSSRFKGVCRSRRGHWQASITIDGRQRSLGYDFLTEEEAARVYDAAALDLYGEFARLNFPDAMEADLLERCHGS